MLTKTQKAFTMVELVFVIVIIGILTAVAIPKFSETGKIAQISKASSELASVRSALSTERQKRILRGDTTAINDLGNVFTNFSAAADNSTPEILQYPPSPCANGEIGCWVKVSGTQYSYKFPDASMGSEGKADFILRENRLVCNDNAPADCAKLEN